MVKFSSGSEVFRDHLIIVDSLVERFGTQSGDRLVGIGVVLVKKTQAVACALSSALGEEFPLGVGEGGQRLQVAALAVGEGLALVQDQAQFADLAGARL